MVTAQWQWITRIIIAAVSGYLVLRPRPPVQLTQGGRAGAGPGVMVGGRGGGGARAEGRAVVQGVLSAVRLPGRLGADGPGLPEGGGQVAHLKGDLQGAAPRPGPRPAPRPVLRVHHGEELVQLRLAVHPLVHHHPRPRLLFEVLGAGLLLARPRCRHFGCWWLACARQALDH